MLFIFSYRRHRKAPLRGVCSSFSAKMRSRATKRRHRKAPLRGVCGSLTLCALHTSTSFFQQRAKKNARALPARAPAPSARRGRHRYEHRCEVCALDFKSEQPIKCARKTLNSLTVTQTLTRVPDHTGARPRREAPRARQTAGWHILSDRWHWDPACRVPKARRRRVRRRRTRRH